MLRLAFMRLSQTRIDNNNNKISIGGYESTMSQNYLTSTKINYYY